MGMSCTHLAEATDRPVPAEPACTTCLAEGNNHNYVHLRLCLTCGNIACCDSSPRQHATAHYKETGHPVMRSAEPDETWRWCYVDEALG